MRGAVGGRAEVDRCARRWTRVYGLMLREDDMVMDDGTVSRLAPWQFLITTVTPITNEFIPTQRELDKVDA